MCVYVCVCVCVCMWGWGYVCAPLVYFPSVIPIAPLGMMNSYSFATTSDQDAEGRAMQASFSGLVRVGFRLMASLPDIW